MNEVSTVDYVPSPVVQDVIVQGTSRSAAPAAAGVGEQVQVLDASGSLASTGAGFDLALVIGGAALVLALGILLLVLGARTLRASH